MRGTRVGLIALAAGWTACAAGAADEVIEIPVEAPAVPIEAAEQPVEAPRPPSVLPEMIPQLVRELDSDSYQRRQRATMLLAGAGPAAVAPVAEAARHGSLEAAARAVRVLESFYTSEQGPLVDAAGEALERLALGDSPAVASRAEQVLDLHYDLRERRAVAAIRRLGGIVKYEDAAPVIANVPQQVRPSVLLVHLGPKWKGGDEGLNLIRRIPGLSALYVSRSEKRNISPVSDQALLDLQAQMPNLRVQFRGLAYLGVRSPQGFGGCFISDVDPNTPAEKAGLRQGDVIVGFGGEATPDFETLVDLIAERSPGDEVEVQLVRNGQPLRTTVTLEEWQP